MNFSKRRFSTLLIALFAGTFLVIGSVVAQAQISPRAMSTVGTGTQGYSVEYNSDGAVLAPLPNPIYLGNGCDAYAPKIGTGQWGQANGGLIVEFTESNGGESISSKISFPRQNIGISGCDLPLR